MAGERIRRVPAWGLAGTRTQATVELVCAQAQGGGGGLMRTRSTGPIAHDRSGVATVGMSKTACQSGRVRTVGALMRPVRSCQTAGRCAASVPRLPDSPGALLRGALPGP